MIAEPDTAKINARERAMQTIDKTIAHFSGSDL
jgi:hypothetical protein